MPPCFPGLCQLEALGSLRDIHPPLPGQTHSCTHSKRSPSRTALGTGPAADRPSACTLMTQTSLPPRACSPSIPTRARLLGIGPGADRGYPQHAPQRSVPRAQTDPGSLGVRPRPLLPPRTMHRGLTMTEIPSIRTCELLAQATEVARALYLGGVATKRILPILCCPRGHRAGREETPGEHPRSGEPHSGLASRTRWSTPQTASTLRQATPIHALHSEYTAAKKRAGEAIEMYKERKSQIPSRKKRLDGAQRRTRRRLSWSQGQLYRA
jgi:hypothetical protein